jgi:hypothetical protein
VLEELSDLLLSSIRQHDMSLTFWVPVDARSVPLYAKIIKRPMDYGSMAEALKGASDRYFKGGSGSSSQRSFDPVRFCADLRLVAFNARKFNKPGSTIWRMADVLFRDTETALRDRLRLTEEQAEELAAIRALETPELPKWVPEVQEEEEEEE